MADNLGLTAEQTEKILQFQVMQIKPRHKVTKSSAVVTRAK